MTNAMFTPGIDGLMKGLIDLDTAVIKCALVRGYSFNAAHEFVSQVVATGTLNGTSAALSGVSVSNGVFDATDTAITVTASASDHALIVFQASAVTGGADVAQSAQRLIAYYDTGTGVPIQPENGSVNVGFDNGANKILKIGG